MGFLMRDGTAESQDRGMPTTIVAPPVVIDEPPDIPKPPLRPEIRQIVERNWPRDEEALRLLGR